MIIECKEVKIFSFIIYPQGHQKSAMSEMSISTEAIAWSEATLHYEALYFGNEGHALALCV